jgi:hypothetical protein
MTSNIHWARLFNSGHTKTSQTLQHPPAKERPAGVVRISTDFVSQWTLFPSKRRRSRSQGANGESTEQVSPSQVIGGTETDSSHYIKTSLGSVGFNSAPGLKISCNPGQNLVLFLDSTRTNPAPRPERPANNSATNDQQSENNAESGVQSTWIPLGISSAERTEVDQPILYLSHSSRDIRSS